MMKSNDGVPSHHGSENKVRDFVGDSLTQNIPRKKIARLLGIHFEVF